MKRVHDFCGLVKMDLWHSQVKIGYVRVWICGLLGPALGRENVWYVRQVVDDNTYQSKNKNFYVGGQPRRAKQIVSSALVIMEADDCDLWW